MNKTTSANDPALAERTAGSMAFTLKYLDTSRCVPPSHRVNASRGRANPFFDRIKQGAGKAGALF